MIKLRDGIITEEIKNNHKEWFWEHFQKIMTDNKELYDNLKDEERKWFNELLGLDAYTKYEDILKIDDKVVKNDKKLRIKEKIKEFIVREDVRAVIEERDYDYKNLIKINTEENKKIEEEFIKKRNELDKKIKNEKNKAYYDEFITFVRENKGAIENKDEIIKKVEENKKNSKKILDMSKTKLKFKEINIEKFIEVIFDYKKFQKEKRHEIISSMKIEVCPYCQRQYTTNYIEENMDKTTADLDHFYFKDGYPYLALSLYNFIPSCLVCNRNFKQSDDFYENEGIYPHKEEFGENVKFKTSANIINTILDNSADFKVKIDVNENAELKDKIKNSIKSFKLNEVYATSHNDYIKDMLDTLEKYPEEYIEVIGDIFYDDKDNKKKKEEMVKHLKEMIKKPYLDRIEKGEPLAKLTKDIMEEFEKK